MVDTAAAAAAREHADLAEAGTAEKTISLLRAAIIDFQNDIQDDEEVALELPHLGRAALLHIDELEHSGPHLILIYGRDSGGNRVRLVQHQSQVSLLLTALRATGKPRRIGFDPSP